MSHYLDRSGSDTTWMADAACRGLDPDLFFPVRGEATAEAKKVCSGCPVQEACLLYALDNTERFGLWGGRSERERHRMRRGERRAS